MIDNNEVQEVSYDVYRGVCIHMRSAFCLSFALDLTAQGVNVKVFIILVHSHITILFYIPGENMRAKYSFIIISCLEFVDRTT